MLLLTTVWAFTIWKSQGQTFTEKVVLNVSDHEREHGLTYVAFSRATRFSNIGLKDGITDAPQRQNSETREDTRAHSA
jgi:ATP-dependent exoDNAse (exonuclease V) alpha subunit